MADYDPSRSIKTVDTIFAILEILRDMEGGRVTEIAERMDMAKSTIYNYLNTLRKYDFVVKEENTYRIGLRFLDYGGYVRRSLPAPAVGQTVCQELARRTGETVWLVTEENGYAVYVTEVVGDYPGVFEGRLGVRVPLVHTAAGELIYSRLPEHRQEVIRENSDARPDQEFDTEVDGRDVNVKPDPFLSGVDAVSTPIVAGDLVHGAVSVGGPTTRIHREIERGNLLSDLVDAANVIEIGTQTRDEV